MRIPDRFKFEFDEAVEPKVSYMICSVPRSGSSLLCEMLANTLHAGMPAEYFRPDRIETFERRWGVEGFDEYRRALLERKTSPNGVFGLKVHWAQYATTVEDRDPTSLFPNLRFVYIRRADRVRQAISWVRAFQTGSWSTLVGPETPPEAVFDRDDIERKIARLRRDEEGWEDLFRRHGISPYRMTYEDLAESPEGAAHRVLSLLGVELPAGFDFDPPLMERQSDELSEKWAARYLAESPRA
jgi:trehalose 2-sulfotransferase